jgi:hypothetical protein
MVNRKQRQRKIWEMMGSGQLQNLFGAIGTIIAIIALIISVAVIA